MILFDNNLDKMRTENGTPIQYYLNDVHLNPLIGKKIKMEFDGVINCVVCNKKIPKAYGQGFCYPCFSESPENAECIIRPELCEGHLGKGRNPEWEFHHHVKEHFVYFSFTNEIKVGVTRSTQMPTRWIDQGAVAAMIVSKVPYRKLAGQIEVAFKAYMKDKTTWNQMLQDTKVFPDFLIGEKERLISTLPDELQIYTEQENNVQLFEYPVLYYPSNLQQFNFTKNPTIEQKLVGIKGQYFIFENGEVLNIRNQSGYKVKMTVLD